MGLRINTNTSSISAQKSLGETVRSSEKVLQKLASGSRINSSADDAAGLAISEKLRGQIRSMAQADRNANDGISIVQVAEGGLTEVNNILVRLRELSIQSASDTLGDTERGFSDVEFQNLKSEVERISQVTEFNGRKLLNGSGTQLDFQIGVNNNPMEDRISYDQSKINSTMEMLGITELSVASKESAQGNLDLIDGAIQRIAGNRADLGALQNRLMSTSRGLQTSVENLQAANSRIRDADFAVETAENSKLQILQSANVAVLAQATNQGSSALKLIG